MKIIYMSNTESDVVIKRFMGELGMPESLTLYGTFKQFQNELEQNVKVDSLDFLVKVAQIAIDLHTGGESLLPTYLRQIKADIESLLFKWQKEIESLPD